MTPWIYGWKMSAKINLMSVWESSWRLMAFTLTSKWYVKLPNFAINEEYCAQIEATESYVIPKVHVRRKMRWLVLSFIFFSHRLIPLFHNSLVYIFLYSLSYLTVIFFFYNYWFILLASLALVCIWRITFQLELHWRRKDSFRRKWGAITKK